MLEEDVNLYISISCLSDMGLEVLVKEEVPGFYTHKVDELMHYYSLLFQMELNYDTLFGPLPILDHFEYLAYIFPYKITNPNVKDERLVAANFIVPAFVLIICPVEMASLIGNNLSKITYELNYSLSREDQTLDGFKSINLSSLNENLIQHLRTEQVSDFFKTDFTAVANIRSRLDEISDASNKHNRKPEILIIDEDPKTLELFKDVIMLRGCANLKSCELKDDFFSAEIDNYKLTIIRRSNLDANLLESFLTNNLLAICLVVDYSPSSSSIYIDLIKNLIKKTPSDASLGLILSEKSKIMSFDLTEIPLLFDSSQTERTMFYELTSLDYPFSSVLTNFLEQVKYKLLH